MSTLTEPVWVELYIKGEDKPKGRAFKVTRPSDANNNWDVDDLTKAVKATWGDTIGVTPEMYVYPPGTNVTAAGADRVHYKPGKVLAELIQELKTEDPPISIDDDIPLVVVAPAPQQMAAPTQSEEKKRRLADLLFYHRSTIETGTSKSSKLAKVKKLEDGSKRCFLCGASGTPTNKIEASHVLQKQDIYATGGEEALLTLDTLKNWSAGYGWKRPFKIHDPMNLIWLCHTHNLAFDRHEFGLSLGGLDSSVVFFSCLKEYAQLVADANARLADPAQPFYDMSYVSRRAIGMRLCKAQDAGFFIDHSNPNAWEAVVALSAGASLKPKHDSDDEEGQEC